MIYLDNNSTTLLHPDVAAAVDECLRGGYANPASPHAAGRRARRVLEEAKSHITEMLGGKTTGMDADRLVITAGGTEANNLALRGLAGPPPSHLLVSAIEHPSVATTADQLRREGHSVDRIPVTSDGVVPPESCLDLLREDTRVVSMMLGNHETGVLQPVAAIVARARATRNAASPPIYFHTDAVQCAGKILIDFRALGVDAMTVSAHKFHGPVGVGGLLLRHGTPLEPILFGGVQQAGLRPGTEPLALVVGMRRGLELWQRSRERRIQQMSELRDLLEAEVRRRYPAVVVNGQGSPRMPHATNLSFPGLDRQALVIALDLAGVVCSTGSACSSGSSEPSPVLLAMRVSEARLSGAIRLSVSAMTTADEVLAAAGEIGTVATEMARRAGVATG